MVTIALAGGGTAGHTSPLIATAKAIAAQDPSATVFAIGTPKGLESRVIPAAGLELEMIPPVPMPRKPSADLLLVGPRLFKAVGEAKAILQRHRADALVGFGGYVSMPAYLAAKQLGLPIIIHEQNAVPGLANKAAAKLTDEVFTSFPETPLPKATHIGLPVRKEIAELDRSALRDQARLKFGLPLDAKVLLVSGGSQGARSINEAITGAVDRLLEAGVTVLHVLGQKNYTEDMVSRTHDNGAMYLPVAYVDHMEEAYAAADLMLARSGAGTVVETAVVGLPTILVPLPHGNGEQARNAEALVHAHGAVLLEDSACTVEWVAHEVPTLIGDAERLAAMSQAAKTTVSGDAAQVLAQRVLVLAQAKAGSRA